MIASPCVRRGTEIQTRYSKNPSYHRAEPTVKLADQESKIGRKLGEWLGNENEEEPTESVLRVLYRKLCNRMKLCFNTQRRIEEKIKEWLTDKEKENNFADFIYIIEESLFKTRQILVSTSHRAILFEYTLAGVLKDKSDKIWRQLVSVHLQERLYDSSLELDFFEFHESIFYHNPNQFSETPKITHWKLTELDKKKARKIYTHLKDKEIAIKETRRQEHLENKIVGGMRPPGAPFGAGK